MRICDLFMRLWCASRFDPPRERPIDDLRIADRPARPAAAKSQVEKYPVMVRSRVYGLRPPRRRPSGRRAEHSMTAFREVLHGEFDPGSGRTLAACLTHASGATNQGLPWGRAANG